MMMAMMATMMMMMMMMVVPVMVNNDGPSIINAFGKSPFSAVMMALISSLVGQICLLMIT
jgi:hypothetical protein